MNDKRSLKQNFQKKNSISRMEKTDPMTRLAKKGSAIRMSQ